MRTMSSFLPSASYYDQLVSRLPIPWYTTTHPLLLLVVIVVLGCWSTYRIIKYLLTPKPFGFIPHLNDQRMIVGDAGGLAKFIKKMNSHTCEMVIQYFCDGMQRPMVDGVFVVRSFVVR